MMVNHDHINYIGRDGFYWFLGVVEDRDDPEKLGRVRVRCFGMHSDNREMIPTDALPWAHMMQAPNAPAAYTPKNGDYVFGFFLDSDASQHPVVMGVLPGKPLKKPNYSKGFSDSRKDMSNQPKKEKYPLESRIGEPTLTRLSRGKATGTAIEKRKKNVKTGVKSAMGASWDEPQPTFNPVYPFNYAHESESGHAFEMDDTPGKERVHLAHMIGSFMEMDGTGDRVEKIIRDNYTLIMGSENVYIAGKCNITVDGDCNLKVTKFNIEADEVNINTAGSFNIKADSFNVDAASSVDVRGAASTKVGTSGVLGLSGGVTTLSGASVSVAGATVGIQMGTPEVPTGLPDFIQDVGVDLGDLPVTDLTEEAKGKSFISKLKGGVGKIKENIQKVADDINTNIVAASNRLNISKELMTKSIGGEKLAFDDVVDSFNELDYATNYKETLIAKDLFPKTTFVTQDVDDLDQAGTKINKIVAPLENLNERVVTLNQKTYEYSGMTESLNNLNSSVHEMNVLVNSSPNVGIPITNIGDRLAGSLPSSSNIKTNYGV